MLEVLIQKDCLNVKGSSCDAAELLNQAKGIAERGDFFDVYRCLEIACQYSEGKELEEIMELGRSGMADSLRLARIDAERGVVSGMNKYLDLASKYSALLDLDIAEEAEEIRALGLRNRVETGPVKPRRRHGIIRIAGYADL